MDLIESLENENTVRGIALNKQIIDLFNIIEESSNRQEAINRVNQYLEENKEAYKTALIKYGKVITTVINEYKQQGVPTVVDMFMNL